MARVHLCEDYSYKAGQATLIRNAETACGVVVRPKTQHTTDVLSVTCRACLEAEGSHWQMEADFHRSRGEA